MKKSLFPLAMAIAAIAFTGCEEPIACDEGNKATLTVYNYTICTPPSKSMETSLQKT